MNWTPPDLTTAPLSAWVRAVPDWPARGVVFRDLTPLWADGRAWARAVDALAKPFDPKPPDVVFGIEARGFLVASALAARWKSGIFLARKPGKLPGLAVSEEFELEYGRATIESHADLLAQGTRVLIADDVLATGGTAVAARSLVHALGADLMGFAFLVEISFLEGRGKLGNALPIHSVIAYGADGSAQVRE